MDSYILAGIVGTAIDGNDSLFEVEKFRAYNIADGCLHDFTVNEVISGAVKISGIAWVVGNKDYLDMGVPLVYDSVKCKFYVGNIEE